MVIAVLPAPFYLLGMGKIKKIKEPSLEDEKKLNDVIENKKEEVFLLGSKWKIGYLRNGTRRMVSDVVLSEKDDSKVNSKCAALLLLNGYFKIFFLYWFLWRWFYYVKQYHDSELLNVIEVCKKKVDLESYYVSTIYLTEMRDTMMTMTRKEVNRFLREKHGEQPGSSEKSTDASLNP